MRLAAGVSSHGFHIAQTRVNHMLPVPEVDPDDVAAVRETLGFHDLILNEEPNVHLRKQFTTMIPTRASEAAARWEIAAPALARWFTELRKPNIPAGTRARIMEVLRAAATDLETGVLPGGW